MIGRLTNRITFKSKTGVSDNAGGFVNTLADYYTCWAQIVRDNESKTNLVEKDSINNGITFRIRSFKNNLYLINSVINEHDRNQYFLISCSTMK